MPIILVGIRYRNNQAKNLNEYLINRFAQNIGKGVSNIYFYKKNLNYALSKIMP